MDRNETPTDTNGNPRNIQPYEKIEGTGEAEVNVFGLTKLFGNLRAVDSLSFRAYSNHVCASRLFSVLY